MCITTQIRRLDTARLGGLLNGKILKYIRRPSTARPPEQTIGQYIKGQKAITAYRNIADTTG